MNSKSKKVAILIAFVLFGLTLNSCKKCGKEAGRKDGNDDTASDTSNSTDATDSTDQQGSTDTTGSDDLSNVIGMPGSPAGYQSSLVDDRFEIKTAPDGTLDPAQWVEYIAYVNGENDVLHKHRQEMLADNTVARELIDSLNSENDENLADSCNLVLAVEEKNKKVCEIMKILLCAWNIWQTGAANDTSSTAEATRQGMEDLKKAMQTALYYDNACGKNMVSTWEYIAIRCRLYAQEDNKWTPRQKRILLMYAAAAYKRATCFVAQANYDVNALNFYEKGFNDTVAILNSKLSQLEDAWINFHNENIEKVAEYIKTNDLPQLIANSNLDIPPQSPRIAIVFEESELWDAPPASENPLLL
jgi:hypothetical protein